jgi:hypothetical protein
MPPPTRPPRPHRPVASSRSRPAAPARALGDLGVGPGDLGLTQGSSGGDLLFAESCLDRGARVRLMLPEAEDAFLEESVRASDEGEQWVRRYHAVKARLDAPPAILPEAPGTGRAGRFERCNRWLLETALGWGRERFCFICLWDGGPSGGAGGTADFVDDVRRRGLPVIWLDARLL